MNWHDTDVKPVLFLKQVFYPDLLPQIEQARWYVFCKPGFKFSMFDDVISSHPIENKFRFVGNPDNVIFHCVRQQTSFIDLKIDQKNMY